MESLFTPYQAALLPGRRVLVLAPHPDDEVLGCGGTLCQLAQQGAHIEVYVLSSGEAQGRPNNETLNDAETQQSMVLSHEPVPNELSAVRRQESQCAQALLGYTTLEFLSFPDGEFAAHQAALISCIQQLCNQIAPDLVLCPSIWEMHRDHRAVAEATLCALKETLKDEPQSEASSTTLAMYEVGRPLPVNHLVDISAVFETKKAAIDCFNSQLAVQSYDQHIIGLNQFRCYTLPKTALAAEGFYCCPADKIADLVDAETPWSISQMAHDISLREIERQHQLVQLERQLNAVYQSHSWKITRPLRWLRHWLRRRHTH